MTSNMKGKGRPKGSEIDDSVVLTAVANMICGNPALRPTTAMRKIRRKASDAEIRRWQSKWKERKEVLLEEARVRAEERQQSTRRAPGVAVQRRLDLSAASKAAGNLLNSPAMRIARELENSPAMRIARELRMNPAYRLAQELQNSPAMRIARELQSSSISRVADKHRETVEKLQKMGIF